MNRGPCQMLQQETADTRVSFYAPACRDGQQGLKPGPTAQSRHPLERNVDNWHKGQMGCQLCSQEEHTGSYSTEQCHRCCSLSAASNDGALTLSFKQHATRWNCCILTMDLLSRSMSQLYPNPGKLHLLKDGMLSFWYTDSARV